MDFIYLYELNNNGLSEEEIIVDGIKDNIVYSAQTGHPLSEYQVPKEKLDIYIDVSYDPIKLSFKSRFFSTIKLEEKNYRIIGDRMITETKRWINECINNQNKYVEDIKL